MRCVFLSGTGISGNEPHHSSSTHTGVLAPGQRNAVLCHGQSSRNLDARLHIGDACCHLRPGIPNLGRQFLRRACNLTHRRRLRRHHTHLRSCTTGRDLAVQLGAELHRRRAQLCRELPTELLVDVLEELGVGATQFSETSFAALLAREPCLEQKH